jgi:branched-chain amino acid transport system substrate-binding protein
MNKSTGLKVFYVLFALFLLVGLTFGLSDKASAEGTVRIGVIGPMTGPAAETGMKIKDAAILAADEINSKGGIMGQKIKLFFGDTESKPSAGVAAVERLISKDNVNVLTGGLHSHVALAVMEVPARYKIPYILTGPASDTITKRIQDNMNKYKLTFKTDPSARKSVMGGWVQFNLDMIQKGNIQPKTKRYAIISENNDYGRSMAEPFQEGFNKNGWTCVAYELVEIQRADFMPVLSKIKKAKPELLWTVQTSAASGVALLKQFREIEIPAVFESHYASTKPEYIELAGSAANGVINCSIDVLPGHAFIDRFENKWGFKPEVVAGWQYDVIHMIAKAYEKASSMNPEKFAEEYGQIDYKGVTGRYVYGQDDHETKVGPNYLPPIGRQYWDGKQQVIYPFDLKVAVKYRTPPWMK